MNTKIGMAVVAATIIISLTLFLASLLYSNTSLGFENPIIKNVFARQQFCDPDDPHCIIIDEDNANMTSGSVDSGNANEGREGEGDLTHNSFLKT